MRIEYSGSTHTDHLRNQARLGFHFVHQKGDLAQDMLVNLAGFGIDPRAENRCRVADGAEDGAFNFGSAEIDTPKRFLHMAKFNFYCSVLLSMKPAARTRSSGVSIS